MPFMLATAFNSCKDLEGGLGPGFSQVRSFCECGLLENIVERPVIGGDITYH